MVLVAGPAVVVGLGAVVVAVVVPVVELVLEDVDVAGVVGAVAVDATGGSAHALPASAVNPHA